MGARLGQTQEPIQTTAQERTQKQSDELEVCSLCLNRYQRVRQSVCTCNHCSLPLCSDCMADHIDELPKNIAQLSQQFHKLERLFQAKKDMVQQESSQSTAEIKQSFKTYHDHLIEAHHTIIVGVENAKKEAEKYLDKIHSELQTIHNDIETLSREPIFQPKRMEALSMQLNEILQKLETYEMTKDSELQIVIPKYTIKFHCTPSTTTDAIELTEYESSKRQDNSEKKSSRRNKFHPYKKASNNVGKKNVLPHYDPTDRN